MPLLSRLTPTDEQGAAIVRMVNEPSGAALQGSDLGTGKTLMAVETMLRLGAKTILVSTPLNVRWGWFDTFKRQTDYEMPVNFITNSTKTGKLVMQALKDKVPGVYIIGRELFRLTDWSDFTIDGVIHDECHTFSNRQSRGFASAFDLRKRTGFTIAQSATWFGSNFSGAWAVTRVLFPDAVERSFWNWVDNWCNTTYDRYAPDNRRIIGELLPGAFASRLPCYINLRSKATDPALVEDIYIDLSPKQRRLYDEMEAQGVTWLEQHPLVAELPPVQHTRLRQITLAEASINDDGLVVFEDKAKSSKFDALKEMLSDLPDQKVLIATDSAKFARMVANRLGDDAFAWTGDKSNAQRDKAKGQFIKGKLKYIVATQGAISEGVDGFQEVSHILVVLSSNDQEILNQQMVGRLRRTGQTKRVLVYRIMARNTLDDAQNDTLLARALSMRGSTLKGEVAA